MGVDNEAMGGISKPLEIDSDEFARYMRAKGVERTLHSLCDLAFKKGAGHKY
jgi:hypothetical protein